MNFRQIRFANHSVCVTWEDEAAGDLVNFLLGGIPEGPAAPGQVNYRLSKGVLMDEFCLSGSLPDEDRTGSKGQIGLYLMERVTYHLADHSQGGLLFHAASLAVENGVILLPGDSGVRKSSLTVWLTGHGFQYLTDELSFVQPDSLTCEGLNRPVHLKNNTARLFPQLNLGTSLPLTPLGVESSGWLVPSTALNHLDLKMTCRSLRWILFPRFSPQAGFEFTSLSPAEAILRLTGRLINARNLPDHGFPDLTKIARSVPAYELNYPSFDRLDEVFGQILGDSPR
jgi:hypothetical protein